jgi:hypothetical protein
MLMTALGSETPLGTEKLMSANGYHLT